MRNIPRLFPAVWAALALALSSSAGAQDKPGPGHGGVAIEATSKAEMFKIEHDSSPIPRDFLDQPPLIPHPTEGFQITRNFNICMQCHSWSRYRETGAVKVSRTHFSDPSTGAALSDLSPSRYFCTQCHVPQFDAKPLVANEFKPVESFVQPERKK